MGVVKSHHSCMRRRLCRLRMIFIRRWEILQYRRLGRAIYRWIPIRLNIILKCLGWTSWLIGITKCGWYKSTPTHVYNSAQNYYNASSPPPSNKPSASPSTSCSRPLITTPTPWNTWCPIMGWKSWSVSWYSMRIGMGRSWRRCLWGS